MCARVCMMYVMSATTQLERVLYSHLPLPFPPYIYTYKYISPYLIIVFILGIPSTLNKLATNADGAWVLQPWPSWEMNRLGDCSALQFVQSFEIDPSTNMMWVIDVGSTATFSGDPDHTCPPKLMLIDLVTGLVDDSKTVVFTDQEASHTTNFLNDIVIDRERQICYITDTSEAGGIIGVYVTMHADWCVWGGGGTCLRVRVCACLCVHTWGCKK